MQEKKNKPEEILSFFKKQFVELKDVKLKDIGEKGKVYHGFALFHIDPEY